MDPVKRRRRRSSRDADPITSSRPSGSGRLRRLETHRPAQPSSTEARAKSASARSRSWPNCSLPGHRTPPRSRNAEGSESVASRLRWTTWFAPIALRPSNGLQASFELGASDLMVSNPVLSGRSTQIYSTGRLPLMRSEDRSVFQLLPLHPPFPVDGVDRGELPDSELLAPRIDARMRPTPRPSLARRQEPRDQYPLATHGGTMRSRRVLRYRAQP
jgi:hypothetical protein